MQLIIHAFYDFIVLFRALSRLQQSKFVTQAGGGGALYLPKKLTLSLVVALKRQAKTTELTTPNVQISPISSKNWTLVLPAGALTTFPCKFGPNNFSPPWGCTCTRWLRVWFVRGVRVTYGSVLLNL